MRWLAAAAAVLLIGIRMAGAHPPPPNYAPIPPLREEVVPALPGPRVVWQPGHWHWDGYRYVWFRGHYVERRPHYARYAEGRWIWATRQGRWIWRPAHWE